MADKRYDDLKLLDPGVAEAYKRATGGNPRAVIQLWGAKLIVKQALGDKTITANETAALIYLMSQIKLLPEDPPSLFREDAYNHLVLSIKQKLEEGILGKKRLTGKALEPVREALNLRIVGEIEFMGPYTMVTYSPAHYLSILGLIERGEILVYEVNLGEWSKVFSGLGGKFNSITDHLTVYTGGSQNEKLSLIVHEATHAIQDFLEYEPLHKYVEADAYLAHALADHALRRKQAEFAPGTTRRVAFDAVEPFVKSGAPLAGQKLVKVLDDIADSVVRDPEYAAKANERFIGRQDRRPGEKAMMLEEFRKVLEQAEKRLKAVGSYVEGSIDSVLGKFRELLPGS